jgi:ABC-type transporter Mla subunit MlaD
VSSEAKVGFIFVLVVVVAAAAGIFLGGYWQRLGTYDIYLHMADAGTVQQGADIMLSGVKVGSVASVELRPDPTNWPGRPVIMTLALKRSITVPDNYIFSIAQGGILANRYISIPRRAPRSPRASSRPASPSPAPASTALPPSTLSPRA